MSEGVVVLLWYVVIYSRWLICMMECRSEVRSVVSQARISCVLLLEILHLALFDAIVTEVSSILTHETG